MSHKITVVILCLVLTIVLAFGAVPQKISYQGVLTDAGGVLVPNGTYNLAFRIYNVASGGTALWTENQSVQVTDGLFNINLGEVASLSLPFDEPYWMGVTVGAGTELSPRVELTSGAYSLTANSVVDNAVTTPKIADGAVTQGKLAPGVSLPPGGTAGGDLTGTYPNPTIANNAVSTSKINDGAVTQAKLDPGVSLPPGGTAGGDLTGTYPNPTIANNAVTTAKINDGAVTQAKLAPGVSLPPGGIAGGDLSGNYPNPTVDGLQGRTVSAAAPVSDQVLKWNGSSWAPGVDNAGTSVWTTSGDNIYNNNTGNVGIGVTNPTYKLQVDGDVHLPYSGRFFAGAYPGLWWNSSYGSVAIGAPNPVNLTFYAGTAGASDPKMILRQNTSNFGVGTTNPVGRIHAETDRRYAGYFTSDSLSPTTQVIHAEFTGTGTSVDARAVYGYSRPTNNYGYGGYFEGGYRGVYGYCDAATTGGVGIYGYGTASTGTVSGVYGYAGGGTSGSRYGVYGIASGGGTAYAGYFSGNVRVTGTLSKGGGSFIIDHPLDPENKYLYHSFVESPDMMNVYNGNVTLDANGEAWIDLPEWFEAVNRDFRYQLTCIGGFAPVFISEKISNNRFKIAGGSAGMEVSWQVTGIRHDAFAEKNRIPVEEWKSPEERGKYLHPTVFGFPESRGLHYEEEQEALRRDEQARRRSNAN